MPQGRVWKMSDINQFWSTCTQFSNLFSLFFIEVLAKERKKFSYLRFLVLWTLKRNISLGEKKKNLTLILSKKFPIRESWVWFSEFDLFYFGFPRPIGFSEEKIVYPFVSPFE